MAQNEYTLAIKSTLPQDISALTIDKYRQDSDGFQKPEFFGDISIQARTPAQVPLYTGPKVGYYVWTIDCALIEADMLKLDSLHGWQKNRLENQLDGRLTLTDENFYLKPRQTLTRSVVSTLTTNDGQSYGYPIVDVKITSPIISRISNDYSGNLWYQCIFQAEEVFNA